VWQIDTSWKNQVVQASGLKIKLVHCYTQRNNAMTALAGLKLTAAQKPTQMTPIQQRRNKLAKRLWEQAELARAQQAGTTFAPTRFRSVVQNDTGQRIQVEQAKRIKQWWFVADTGKLVLSVRYGTKLLELAKGKWAVEVGSEKDLVPTLELLKGAVLAGELDTQIEAASIKLRDGFGG
jgi:ABC-type phosphate/phosphonate transport system ATPase subunit